MGRTFPDGADERGQFFVVAGAVELVERFLPFGRTGAEGIEEAGWAAGVSVGAELVDGWGFRDGGSEPSGGGGGAGDEDEKKTKDQKRGGEFSHYVGCFVGVRRVFASRERLRCGHRVRRSRGGFGGRSGWLGRVVR